MENLTAAEIMSRVLVTVKPDESPLMAWELMRRAGVHHLPVVDAHARLVGIVTRADIAAAWSGGPDEQSRRAVRTLVAGRCTPEVRPGDYVGTVAAVMLDGGCDAVPVFGDDGTVIGLITVRDILEAIAGRAAGARPRTEEVSAMFRLEPVLPCPADLPDAQDQPEEPRRFVPAP
jgi:CBS-domain-containing membrane protein